MAFFKVDDNMVAAAAQVEADEAKAFTMDSGFYPVQIQVAYLTESTSSSAAGMTIEYTDGKWKFPRRETMWFQGKDGTTTRMAKKSDGSEYPDETFGMKQVRALAAVTGLSINSLETSDGVIETKDGNKNVKVFADFAGKTFTIGLQAAIEDKYGEESESRNVMDVIWVGRSDTDAEGFVFPWGRKTPSSKFQSVIDAEPTVDRREQSKPGSAGDIPASPTAGFGMPFSEG